MSSALKYIFLILFIGLAVFFVLRVYRHFHPVIVPLPPRQEITITIIPGWNLRQVAEYLVLKGVATSTQAVYAITGEPATVYKKWDFFGPSLDLIDKKPGGVSLEGYLAPETLRVFVDSDLAEGVIGKFVVERNRQIENERVIAQQKIERSWHEILTMASIIEKETRHDEDRARVADILWRRLKKGWALQVDSSVHYVIDKNGDVFTTDKEREVNSPWNTYKYPGLPPGPICNPGLASIKAALFPEKNDYWYFLSGRDGRMYYGKTLEEHNANKRYL